MKVHPWLFLPEERTYTIEEFAQMEIQVTEPNECGVFVEPGYVNIPVGSGCGCALGMAKSRAGMYHISYRWAGRTGCNTCGVSPSNGSFKNKEEAFIGGLNLIQRLFKSDGLYSYLAEAKREFFRYHHRQLSLFD